MQCNIDRLVIIILLLHTGIVVPSLLASVILITCLIATICLWKRHRRKQNGEHAIYLQQHNIFKSNKTYLSYHHSYT